MPWSRFRKKRDMPEGLWSKCKECGTTLYQKDLEEAMHVCSECGHHMRIGAAARVATLVDGGHAFEEHWPDLYPTDPLAFVDKGPYIDKLASTAKKTGKTDAATAGLGLIDGQPVALCILDFSFMGGSMGMVVGERVTRTIELALEHRIPAVVLSCSGGARMHEGALSLMQMAKTSALLARLQEEKGLYISVLANPTTGGVMASFAALGDIILAEPGALIGFAGPRVIQETLRIELPEGFQTSEFLLEHGFIDRIVSRKNLRGELSRLFSLLWTYDDDLTRPIIDRLTKLKEAGEAADAAKQAEEDAKKAAEEADKADDGSAADKKAAPKAEPDATPAPEPAKNADEVADATPQTPAPKAESNGASAPAKGKAKAKPSAPKASAEAAADAGKEATAEAAAAATAGRARKR